MSRYTKDVYRDIVVKSPESVFMYCDHAFMYREDTFMSRYIIARIPEYAV